MFQNITQIVKNSSNDSNVEDWHYLTMKKLPALLREITSKHPGDVYCLNCFHSFATKKI